MKNSQYEDKIILLKSKLDKITEKKLKAQQQEKKLLDEITKIENLIEANEIKSKALVMKTLGVFNLDENTLIKILKSGAKLEGIEINTTEEIK